MKKILMTLICLILVWATHAIAADMTVSPLIHDFGTVQIGNSVQQVFTVKNETAENRYITVIQPYTYPQWYIPNPMPNVADNFTIISQTCLSAADNITRALLPPNGSCTFTVRFAPTTGGNKGTYLDILMQTGPDNLSPVAQIERIYLSGLADDGIEVTPTRHEFPAIELGATSQPKTFTITNKSAQSRNILLSGYEDPNMNYVYAVVNNTCGDSISGKTLSANESCSFDVLFRPNQHSFDNSTSITRILTLGVMSNSTPTGAILSNKAIYLIGRGDAKVSVSDLSYNFGTFKMAETSFPKRFTITNNSSQQRQIIVRGYADNVSPTTQGSYYAIANTCGDTMNGVILGQGQSCYVDIVFKAGDSYDFGSLNVDVSYSPGGSGMYNFVGRYQISLSGRTDTGVVVSDARWDFGNVPVGTVSEPKRFKITNTGTETRRLYLSFNSYNQNFALTNNTCSSLSQTQPAMSNESLIDLSPNQSCTFDVVFQPSGTTSTLTTNNQIFASVSVGIVKDITQQSPIGNIFQLPSISLTGTSQTQSSFDTGLSILTFNPSSSSYGAVQVGTESVKTITFTNPEGMSRYVYVSGFDNDTPFVYYYGSNLDNTTARFLIRNNTCGTASSPKLLNAQESCSFDIVFKPLSGGLKSKTLTIYSSPYLNNIFYNSSVSFTLTGIGVYDNTTGTVYYHSGTVGTAEPYYSAAFGKVEVVEKPSIFSRIDNTSPFFMLAGIPANMQYQLRATTSHPDLIPIYSRIYTATGNRLDNGTNVPGTGMFFYSKNHQAIAPLLRQGKAIITARIANFSTATLQQGMSTTWQGMSVSGVSINCVSQLKGGSTCPYPIAYHNDLTGTSDANLTATTSAGRFYIYDVDPADTVTVTATKNGWFIESHTFKTHADSISMSNMPAYRTSVSGYVNNVETGMPVEGATVKIYEVTSTGNVPRGTAITRYDGRYFYAGVPFGRYIIELEKGAYEVISAPMQPMSISSSAQSLTYNINVMNYTGPQAILHLNAGWNFVSFSHVPPSSDPATFFANKPVNIVWAYNAQTQEWLRWKSGTTSGNNLTEIKPLVGYWIYMNQPISINMTGWDEPQNKTIALYPGWNLVGYGGADSVGADNALAAVTGNWQVLWTWDAGQWKAKTNTSYILPTSFVETFTLLQPRKAYWIKVQNQGQWQQ